MEQPYVMDDAQRVQDVVKVRRSTPALHNGKNSVGVHLQGVVMYANIDAVSRLAEIQWGVQLRPSHLGFRAPASGRGPERGCVPTLQPLHEVPRLPD